MTFAPIGYTFFPDADGDDGTSAVASGIEARQEFSHPCGRCAVFREQGLLADFDGTENIIEIFCTRHNNTDTDNIAFIIGAHREQIAVKGLILRVPLQIKRNAVFDKIDIVTVNIAVNTALLIWYIGKSSALIRFTRIFFYDEIACDLDLAPSERI